jgi:hypothetical protein
MGIQLDWMLSGEAVTGGKSAFFFLSLRQG